MVKKLVKNTRTKELIFQSYLKEALQQDFNCSIKYSFIYFNFLNTFSLNKFML